MIDLIQNDVTPSKKTAVALGVFDGLHKGHRSVINTAAKFDKEGLDLAVFTFNTKSVTSKADGKLDILLSDELKFKMFEELGVKYVFSPDFYEIKEFTPKMFVKKILVERLNAKIVVCGENFRFGKNASAGIDELNKLCEEYDIKTVVVPFLVYEDKPISSTIIRNLIKDGDIETANELLGYDFHFRSKIVAGNRLGRTINFPTINQNFSYMHLVPKYGVYASVSVVKGKWLPSITNIGVKPTVGDQKKPLSETHIIDFDENLYGKEVTVYLKKYIRSEKKFNGLDELKKQIKDDIEVAKNYFDQKGSL